MNNIAIINNFIKIENQFYPNLNIHNFFGAGLIIILFPICYLYPSPHIPRRYVVGFATVNLQNPKPSKLEKFSHMAVSSLPYSLCCFCVCVCIFRSNRSWIGIRKARKNNEEGKIGGRGGLSVFGISIFCFAFICLRCFVFIFLMNSVLLY